MTISAASIKAQYARVLDETIIIRRFTGSGLNPPRFDAEARGKATRYGADELIGGIIQGDQRVIVFSDDLIANGFALPVVASDKVVVAGKPLTIVIPTERKAPDGTLVAYELQCRG